MTNSNKTCLVCKHGKLNVDSNGVGEFLCKKNSLTLPLDSDVFKMKTSGFKSYGRTQAANCSHFLLTKPKKIWGTK